MSDIRNNVHKNWKYISKVLCCKLVSQKPDTDLIVTIIFSFVYKWHYNKHCLHTEKQLHKVYEYQSYVVSS